MTADSLAKAAEEPDAAAASSVRQRKKRKWDQPAESLFYGGLAVPGCLPFEMGNLTGIGVAPFSNSVFMNSAAAVCTTASQLHNAPAMTQKTSQPKIQDELIAREIVINDADSAVRCKLTKRQTQEEIQRSTGAVVITRGKYRPPNALPDSEKPLYLHISAGAHLKDTGERIKAVDRAASMVEDIFKQSHSASLVSTSYSALNTGVQVLQPLTRCLYLGFDPDPSVNIAARMQGPNDQYINHIMNETGATVMLRGKGSGNIGIQNVGETEQPLHLFISSSNQKSLEDARILAENLLDTISVEFGAIRVPPSKVYKAVPPPPQLLDGVESSVPASPSIDTSTVKSHISSSVPVSSAASAAYISGSSLHYGVKSYGPHPTDGSSYKPLSISGGANYNGYEGMYPQAMALQQVALALRGAPVSASPAPMVVPSGTSLKSKASLGPESDKRPQKRKFQELPISSGVSQQSSGGLGVSSDGLPLSNGLSSPPSNGASPPQPPKNKLPPVPKFPQPSFTKELVPDPLMKLMEYGDDVDDGDSIGSSESAVNTESMASSAAAPTSKPFWAV